MSKRLIAMLAGLVAIAVIATGCGSSSDDSTEGTDSTATLTKAEFIQQADAICTSGNKEIEAGFESFMEENGISENEEPSKEQGTELSETVLIPKVKAQGEEIAELPAPSGDEAEITAMLDALDEGVEEAEADPEALFSSDTDPFAPANKLAREYGLKVCGEE